MQYNRKLGGKKKKVEKVELLENRFSALQIYRGNTFFICLLNPYSSKDSIGKNKQYILLQNTDPSL